MALKMQPRLKYEQPKAICRTLVFNWAGHLLCTRDHETHIIAHLTAQTVKGSSELDEMTKIQGKRHQTAIHGESTKTVKRPIEFPDKDGRNYVRKQIKRGGEMSWANTNSIKARDGTNHEYDCFAIVTEAPLTVQTYENKFAFELLNCATTTRKQSAFALTILYDYVVKQDLTKQIPNNSVYFRDIKNNTTYIETGESSGHCVGFYFSNGGIGNRSAGCRFFDPNNGSWHFGSHGQGIQWFMTDWLPNFVNATLNGDPGHSKKHPNQIRRVKGYRLGRFLEA